MVSNMLKFQYFNNAESRIKYYKNKEIISLENIIDINDCNCNGDIQGGVIGCRGCNSTNPQVAASEINQKRIQNQVRVQSSQLTNVLGSITIKGPQTTGLFTNKPLKKYSFVNWNQGSDRNIPSNQTFYVPGGSGKRKANSTRSTTTSLKPGALSPGGKGVDIKHNSYDRYLGRLKAQNLYQGPPNNPNIEKPNFGNKTTKYSLLANCGFCQEPERLINNNNTSIIGTYQNTS